MPITAQTLGVMLAGSVLGARRGFLALLLFLVAGRRRAAGAARRRRRARPSSPGRPRATCSAGRSRAFVIGLLTERFWRALQRWPGASLANVLGGILVIYAIGVPVLTGLVADLPLRHAVVVGRARRSSPATWSRRVVAAPSPYRCAAATR